MSQLPITLVANVSVNTPQTGAGAYNTSNLALFTNDVPGGGFGVLGYKIYLSSEDVATDFGTASDTYKMALGIFSQQPNILAGGGYLVIIPFLALETLDAAITRTQGLIQYFGVISAQIESQVNMLAAAAVLQAINKIGFFVSRTSADVNPGGKLDLLRSGSFTHSRGLYYGAATNIEALVMMSSYAARLLSVDFSGSLTTITMHLKQLSGIQPDSSMTVTLLNLCLAAGADTYVSLQGVPGVFCSGTNAFVDQVYNLLWFVGAIQIGNFNVLAQVGTKVSQTENGVSLLKSADRVVCEQAVTNEYIAPGSWTSPTTFGDQANFLANIASKGYYIYTQPVSQQSQVARAARQAPLTQIAIKEAGAIHSANIIINVNA